MPKYRTKDVQLPSGTRKGSSVYPLAPTLPFKQQITPVTLVSAIDTNGKQQPYMVAPDTGILNAFELQGGSATIADGGTAVSDVIDMSLHDTLILFPWASAPLLPGTLEIDVVGAGIVQADDGTAIGMNSSTSGQTQIKHLTDSVLFTDLLNDPDVTTDSAVTALRQYKITGLHGLMVGIAIKNDTGSSLVMNCYQKKVRFMGA